MKAPNLCRLYTAQLQSSNASRQGSFRNAEQSQLGYVKYIFTFPNPKTWEKSPNHIKIRPNLTYSVPRVLVTGLAVPKVPQLIKLRRRQFFVCTVFCTFLNLCEKPTICSTCLETGCKQISLIVRKRQLLCCCW